MFSKLNSTKFYGLAWSNQAVTAFKSAIRCFSVVRPNKSQSNVRYKHDKKFVDDSVIHKCFTDHYPTAGAKRIAIH